MKHSAVPRNLRVAFVGDTHLTESTWKMFKMMKEWTSEVPDSFAIVRSFPFPPFLPLRSFVSFPSLLFFLDFLPW
jgi:hypothetical protein